MFIVPLMVPLEEEASVGSVGSPQTLNLQAADFAAHQSFVYLLLVWTVKNNREKMAM